LRDSNRNASLTLCVFSDTDDTTTAAPADAATAGGVPATDPTELVEAVVKKKGPRRFLKKSLISEAGLPVVKVSRPEVPDDIAQVRAKAILSMIKKMRGELMRLQGNRREDDIVIQGHFSNLAEELDQLRKITTTEDPADVVPPPDPPVSPI